MVGNLRVRHWALLTVLLYGAACTVLTWPFLVAAFAWGKDRWPLPEQALQIYTAMPFWLAIDLLMVLQSVFLLLPIDVAKEKPVARRRWAVVAVAAALMMGLLVFGLVCAVGEVVTASPFVLEDGGPPLFGKDTRTFLNKYWRLLAAVAFAVCTWAAWALIFLRQAFSHDPGSAFQRVVRRLLAGSVAELLVAVPCHVYARSKEYCCAGFSTALGLMTGLAVLMFAFGPGVFFLFVARVRRLRGKVYEGAATGEEDETKRLSPHARDAAVWLAVAVGFVLIASASGFLPDSDGAVVLIAGAGRFLPDSYDAAVLVVVCGVAAIVLACKAALQTWRAARDDEPRWYGMAIAFLVVLSAVLLASCWYW
ncbi:MAG: hypothetical protein ABSE73_22435 [Planctomycetota bacterium]